MLNYKFIDHTADIAVEVMGSTLEDMFTASAAALHDSVVEKYVFENLKQEEKQLELEEESIEEVLVSFLSELNFLISASKWIFNAIKEIKIVKNGKWHLKANISGEAYDPAKHILKEEIKAVTYHQMNIVEENEIFKTKIVFDI